jgi:hypothetical protein
MWPVLGRDGQLMSEQDTLLYPEMMMMNTSIAVRLPYPLLVLNCHSLGYLTFHMTVCFMAGSLPARSEWNTSSKYNPKT